MAATYKQYTGDGTNRNFGVTFPYLDKSHVHVYVNGVEVTTFTWLTSAMIQLPVGVATTGAVVLLRRITPTDIIPADFVDGSILSEKDLDLITVYAAYVAAEARETIDGVLQPNAAGNFDALSNKLINLSPGTSPTDAVNKAQVDDALSTVAPAVASASAAAEAAASSASASATASGTASTKAAEAQTALQQVIARLAAVFLPSSLVGKSGQVLQVLTDESGYGLRTTVALPNFHGLKLSDTGAELMLTSGRDATYDTDSFTAWLLAEGVTFVIENNTLVIKL